MQPITVSIVEVEVHWKVLKDVEGSIAKASSAFSARCKPVFHNSSHSLKTKGMVCHAMILGVLLYRAEAWVNKRAAT